MKIEEKLSSMDLEIKEVDWGKQFFKKYRPRVTIPDRLQNQIKNIEIRIEISGPKIEEYYTEHFFEYSLDDFTTSKINFHNKDAPIKVKVPHIEDLTANKLGLPVDYKNNYDSAALLVKADVELVIQTIKENDDWSEMVLRRIPKQIGRIKDTNRVENILARNRGVDLDEYVEKLEHIRGILES
ncbi:MAG: hypothetical protein R6U61_02115 [Thermoplasmata archaeon]